MSLDQKEIPKKLSSDHIDFVVKMMLEKSPLFRVLNMSLYSLDVSNGYFTKDDKFKDDELDAFVSIGSILRLEFGEAGINKIVDKKNIKSDVYAKILSSRVLLPVYILILYKDIIFNTPFEQRWTSAAAALGIDVNLISNVAGHA